MVRMMKFSRTFFVVTMNLRGFCSREVGALHKYLGLIEAKSRVGKERRVIKLLNATCGKLQVISRELPN